MFTVAKAILEVLTVSQRFVIIVLGTASVELAHKSEGF